MGVIAVLFGLGVIAAIALLVARRDLNELRPFLEDVNPPPHPRIEPWTAPCRHGARRLIHDDLGRAWLVCPADGQMERYRWADNLQDRPQDRRGPQDAR